MEAMLFLCNCTLRYSRIPQIPALSQISSSLLKLQKLYSGSYQCNKNFSSSRTRWKKDEVPAALSKYEKFSEETVPIILDVEEERQKVMVDDAFVDEFKGFNLERGATGVFEVKEIVELLKKEKAEDIFVIKIPPKHSYVDYMVIVTGRSARHMLAMSSFVRRLYKKKRSEFDIIPKLEGKESKTWMAIDLGNIVLHVFSKEGREMYDLETLWSMGKEYEFLTKRNSPSSDDLSANLMKILASFSPNTVS